MEIVKKHLDRREWYGDGDRDFSCRYHKDDFFEGGMGLITFTGIKEPDVIDTGTEKICIAAQGYRWLELAPKDGRFVVTAMFRGEDLFQIYVDITARNEIAKNGDALFWDLFLDVADRGDGKAIILDEDELEEAFSRGVISADEKRSAEQTARSLADFYHDNRSLAERKLREYLALFADAG